MISHEYVEELVRRSDIVDVVGNYVQLKRKGRLYGGLCPFHNEKTPSFYVYPETQSFYCFGCGAGGDVITFIKKISSLSYPEAVKLLAERAGMPEPEEDDGTGRMRSRILSMNKEAARFFHACLNSSVDEAAQARAYWRRRGLDDRTISRFGLGYAPNDGQALYHFLRDKGYTQAEMDASGLFKRSQSGRIYCLFWRRVITPIFDLRGNVIAFGGRVLDDSKPKYVNSPETLVYHKSETVFALQIAKKSASRRYVLCEGYMDVISMQQAGVDTAVCACGTALTQAQVRLLSEYADEVILSYDYLWQNIRVKGGAYGCMSNFNRIVEGYLISYRDPNLEKTMEIYEGVVDYLENFNVDDRDMNKFIIGTISNIDRPMNPAAKGSRSMNLYMNHVTEEMIREEREQILTAGQSDIRALSKVLRAMLDAEQICVIGSEEKIEECREMFGEVRTLS